MLERVKLLELPIHIFDDNVSAPTYLTITISPSNTFCPLLRYIVTPSPSSFMIISIPNMDTKIIFVVSRITVRLSGCNGEGKKVNSLTIILFLFLFRAKSHDH